MGLCLDKMLCVKTSSSAGYSLPVSLLKSQWSGKTNWKERVLQHYIKVLTKAAASLAGGIRISTYLPMFKFPLREQVTSPITKDRAGKTLSLTWLLQQNGMC